MADKELPVLDHLTELRKRIIIVLVAVTIATIVFYAKASVLVDFLMTPLSSLNMDIVFFTITEGFTTRIKIAFFAALIVLSPIIIYQIIAFIHPGLKKKERKVLYIGGITIAVFFVVGNLFGYFILLPHILFFLISYSKAFLNASLSGDKYFSFIGVFCISVGVIFTMPVIMVSLAKLNILSHKLLKKIRLPLLLGIIGFQGVMTPSLDIYSILVTALPVLVLYEISIWIIYFIEKSKRKKIQSA